MTLLRVYLEVGLVSAIAVLVYIIIASLGSWWLSAVALTSGVGSIVTTTVRGLRALDREKGPRW